MVSTLGRQYFDLCQLEAQGFVEQQRVDRRRENSYNCQ
jgi:hypothetical protein